MLAQHAVPFLGDQRSERVRFKAREMGGTQTAGALDETNQAIARACKIFFAADFEITRRATIAPIGTFDDEWERA